MVVRATACVNETPGRFNCSTWSAIVIWSANVIESSTSQSQPILTRVDNGIALIETTVRVSPMQDQRYDHPAV
jgi:hypothetical protein